MPATLTRHKRQRLTTNPATPLNRAAADVAPTPEAGPGLPPDLSKLQGYTKAEAERLPACREGWYARAMAGRFDRWFLLWIASHRIPLDDVTGVRETLHLMLEAWLLSLAKWSGSRRTPCLPGCRGLGEDGEPCRNLRRFGASFCEDCAAEQDETPGWMPRTEAEAAALGLTIHRR